MILKKNNIRQFTVAALLIVIIFSFGFFPITTEVKAENYEFVPVNIVEDITLNTNATNVITKNPDFSQKTDSFTESYYYQFTLDSLSYIHIEEFADLWNGSLCGHIKFYISTSTAFSGSSDISNYADGTGASVGNYYTLYEAGIYYMKVDLEFTGNVEREMKKSPYYNFSISAQPIARTGLTSGISQSTAISLPKGSYTTGVISRQNTKQYFTFKQKSAGAFSTDIACSVPSGWKQPGLNVSLCNAAGGVIANQVIPISDSNSTCTLSVANLAKGTYYILVTPRDILTSKRGVCIVTANASYQNMAKLAAPKLKTYKAGTKKITGTAVKGAKVTVKVGKKTYKVTAKKGKFTIKTKSALKKGNTIKVKATKSGYKASKTVSYKVKKR